MHENIPCGEILEKIGDGVAILSEDYKIVFVNNVFRKMHKIEGEIIGCRCYEVFHLCGEPCKECNKEEVSKGKVVKTLHRHFRCDGSPFFVEITCSPLFINGNLKYLIHTARDVTDKIEAERKLKEAVKMKQLLLDILHHDILNAAGLIKGNLELFYEVYNGENKELLEGALYGTRKLLDITENARKYTKLEETREVQREEISLTRLAEQAYHMLEEDFKSKNLEVVLPDREVTYLASPLLRDVFFNLLSIACTFSPEGGRVEVRLIESEKGVTIEVADEGPGVEDEYKEKIFERYKRIEKQGVKGTGLGLAIVRRIAELHPGKAWVEDNFPRGSVFKVFIAKQH